MNLDAQKLLWRLAFGDSPEAIDDFFAAAYSPERCCLIEQGAATVSALYWFDCCCEGQPLAYIYGVATHPEHRGRGYARQLMEKTHAQLKQRGYAGAILMPAEAGLRKMYAAMGYRACTCLSEFSCAAAGEPVKVERISPREYALRRRALLPEGGVIQEGENLAYLDTFAQLYAGEDFLLAAVHAQNALVGLELLGNGARAPQILKAMGYPKGTFRTPGADIPFTMLKPLSGDCPMPTYFGLAFD